VEDHRARIRARNGETIPILISAAEIHDEEGKPVATVGIFRDTRESDSLASRLRQATERLIRSEKRSAAVALAGATAHELNQPLTSVMGIVEIMLAVERSDSEEKRLERAYEQLERMAEIVRDLSRVTQFKTTQYVEGVNILDLQQDLK
jgi:signal transduction histidine kinase